MSCSGAWLSNVVALRGLHESKEGERIVVDDGGPRLSFRGIGREPGQALVRGRGARGLPTDARG